VNLGLKRYSAGSAFAALCRPGELAVLTMRAPSSPANNGQIRRARGRARMPMPRDPHLRLTRWDGRWQPPARLARLRRRIMRLQPAGPLDDSGSGVEPGARARNCRLRQSRFVLGISHSFCRSVRRLCACRIDRNSCCPDQGGMGGILRRHDALRKEDRAARERAEVRRHHPGPGRVGPGEVVGEGQPRCVWPGRHRLGTRELAHR